MGSVFRPLVPMGLLTVFAGLAFFGQLGTTLVEIV